MVYIIVLNWKGAVDTMACIDSIKKLNQSHASYCLIICDNNSPDNSYELIKSHVSFSYQQNASDVHTLSEADVVNGYKPTGLVNSIYLIQNERNGGYAAGNNVGIQLALRDNSCDYIWVLNNDTVVQPNALDSLYTKCINNNKLGVCGSRLVYYHQPHLIQGLGGSINKWLGTTKHLYAYSDSNGMFNEDEIEEKTDYVIGASLFIRKDLIKRIGLLCEDYFLYFEELDYCIRARRAGFSVGVCVDSIIYHKEGASINNNLDHGSVSDFSDYFFWTSKFIFMRKFYPFSYRLFSFVYMVFVKLFKMEFKRLYNLLFVPRKNFLG